MTFVVIKTWGEHQVGGARDAARPPQYPGCPGLRVSSAGWERAALDVLGFSFCHPHFGPMGENHNEDRLRKRSL